MHKIPDSTYAYLKVQAGYVPETREREQWESLYWAMQQMRFESLRARLPEKVNRVVNVGAGMDGMGLLFREHYGRDLELYVVDGVDDDPVMRNHNKTFSNIQALEDFYVANGQIPPRTIHPSSPRWIEADLIVSFAAWCFHIEPMEYMHQAMECKPKLLAVDVRKNKPEWNEYLSWRLGEGQVVVENPKYERRVWCLT